jgi:transposase
MQRYTREFKLQALELAAQPGMTVLQTAHDLGIHPHVLYRWRKQHRKDGIHAFPGKGHLSPQDEELRRLKRENAVLRMERDILKKATAFFARHGN